MSGPDTVTVDLRSQSQENIEFDVIAQPLDSLLSALGYKIEREWPSQLSAISGARELFLLTLRTADVTYRSVRYLCADKPVDPHRKPEYSVSVSPLNRTILDNLFTVLFLLEDLPARCNWFFKADWRETRLSLQKYQAQYAELPSWKDWLTSFSAYSQLGIELMGISPDEVADPATIPRWPNPGQMPNYGISSKVPLPPTRAYMKYLNDWFYADLSQQSHLGGGGLGKRAGALLLNYRSDPEAEATIKRYKTNNVAETVCLILALASELEAHFNFGLRPRLQYVWSIMRPYSALADEICERRYAALLGMSTGGNTVREKAQAGAS